jgi:hypothetical protein
MQTMAVAAIHDHWTEDAGDHGVVALKLSARHFAKHHPFVFAKHHPFVMEILQWGFAAATAVFLLVETLIANA